MDLLSNVQLMKSNREYLDQNYELSLRYFLDNYKKHYELGLMDEAVEYFMLGLRMYEFHADGSIKREFMKEAVKSAIFFRQTKTIHKQLDRIIPYEMFQENYEILSCSYYIKSVLHLRDHHAVESLKLAKMAYFYAQLAETNRANYIRNAELQMLVTLILLKEDSSFTYYLEEFNWREDRATTKLEKLIYQTVLAGRDYILQNEQSINRLDVILTELLLSKEIMYTSYITKFIKRLVTAYAFGQIEPLLFKINYIESQYTRIQLKISDDLPKLPVFDASTFFTVGEELFKKKQLQAEKLYIYKLDMKSVSGPIIKYFIEAMEIIKKNNTNILVYNYSEQKFAVVLEEPFEDAPYYRFLRFLNVNSFLTVQTEEFDSFLEIYNFLTLSMFIKKEQFI